MTYIRAVQEYAADSGSRRRAISQKPIPLTEAVNAAHNHGLSTKLSTAPAWAAECCPANLSRIWEAVMDRIIPARLTNVFIFWRR
ncbi:hypothetical protein D3C87_1303900 [compost metagenome]